METIAKSVSSVASIHDIHNALEHLNQREAQVTARLDELVTSQNDLARELGRLDLLRAQLGSQVVNTRAISSGILSDAASTAHRISAAVKTLDREQANVKAALEVVEQVAELKQCVLGVHGSMGAPQDWETAAGYLSRAAKIPSHVIDGSFAEEIVPTAEVPDPPRVTLDNAAESLCGLFLREFEKATKDGDGARVTRFFKLFPLIGRSDVGLDAYGRYVCQGIAVRARQNLNAGTGGAQRKDGYFYATALTKLFEHIAQIVDAHEPLVERHYGHGMMVKVIERLQVEADVQGGIIFDTWSEERNVDRKLTDIKSYPFSFLVQSFAPTPRGTASLMRSESPANRSGTPGPRNSEDEGVNMKEVDNLLGESAVMLGRWALYTRFLASKTPPSESGKPAALTMPSYLANSNLQKKVSNVLVAPFNVMSTFFFRRSVEKAFQLEEQPQDLTLNISKPLPGNAPYITSAVDDVMYIVNQVLSRSLATSQRGVVANVIPTVGRILNSDFIGMIQRKMRDESYPKAAIQGALPPEDKIISFLVLINNLDVATGYLKRIVSSHLESAGSSDAAPSEGAQIAATFPFNDDAAFVAQSLHATHATFAAKATELLNDGVGVAFYQIVKPRLRPILADAFRDVEYGGTTASDPVSASAADVDAEVDDEKDGNDVVTARFAAAWTQLTRPLRRIVTAHVWERLLSTAVPYLASTLEKRLWALHGRVSELGAVRLERDVAGIVGAACGDARYGVRDAFARCVQIVLVAGMEGEEWEELVEKGTEGEGIVWVLEEAERRRARGLVARGV